jgi:hypothetical protein
MYIPFFPLSFQMTVVLANCDLKKFEILELEQPQPPSASTTSLSTNKLSTSLHSLKMIEGSIKEEEYEGFDDKKKEASEKSLKWTLGVEEVEEYKEEIIQISEVQVCFVYEYVFF